MLAGSTMMLKPAPDAALPSTVSAWSIDEELLRHAHLEASARVELGRAAGRFLALGGYHPLGFSRLGDYARERLGISGREVQSFAFVASRLERLTLVARAFAQGEISWSQVRLLCAAAEADSEARWLERARGLSVGELVAEIRLGSRDASAVGDVADALDDESDSTEGEPRLRFSVPCPARITLLWRRALELACRMLGSQAPIWQAAEAIVAEASSSVAIEADAEVVTDECTTAAPRLVRAPREVEASKPAAELESLDAFGLDTEMREIVGLLQSIDADLGAVLRRVVDLRIYRALGFDAFDAYVRERLGISPAKARALVMVERRCHEIPALAEAYRSGALSWVRALTILPVLRDAPDASAWVARAQEVMVRRLRDEVEWTLDKRDAYQRPPAPPERDAELEEVALQTCAHPSDGAEDEVIDHRVTFFGPASVVALFEAGVAALTSPREHRWRGLERLLLHAITEWEAQPRHRDPIFARDRWRCTTPGCSGRRGLHDHHIEYRSRGGGNEQWDRTAVCAAHHLHAVHMNVIGASGRAPFDIVWELGLRPGQAPLLRLQAERYLSVL